MYGFHYNDQVYWLRGRGKKTEAVPAIARGFSSSRVTICVDGEPGWQSHTVTPARLVLRRDYDDDNVAIPDEAAA